MTTVKPELADADAAADTSSDESFRDAALSYLQRVRGGDMGSLPAVLGLVVLFIVFGLANERFLSALNLANLVTQAGSICVLAMGLVFVTKTLAKTVPTTRLSAFGTMLTPGARPVSIANCAVSSQVINSPPLLTNDFSFSRPSGVMTA